MDKEDKKYVYLSEEEIQKVISKLIFEIEKLRDENDSLWLMLEEIEQSDIEGKKVISSALSDLKLYKDAFSKKPAEA